jgi:molybdopterin-dependent oxidoreductase alpha subunit
MSLLPRHWVSLSPWGLGYRKPSHYLDMARAAWQSRGRWRFASRILRQGACDGCALGTSGLSDWTLRGTHLCLVRLDLLRYNTARELDVAALADVSTLAGRSSAELRGLGRLPVPLVRRRGDAGFTPLGWDEALDLIAQELRQIDPQRTAFYVTSRGITNEVYYAAQKAARFLGTNHVDNAGRICHAASSVALRSALGIGAATSSYADWIGADLVVLFGSNTPNTQPVTLKYLHEAKRRGTEVAVVNPFREPGFERYWIPSRPASALFGTRIADHWFDVNVGGDLGLLVGVLKALDAAGQVDRAFVEEVTTGGPEAMALARACDWTAVEAASGTARARIEEFAGLLAERPNTVLVWSTGLTQHAHGVDTIKALVNVALARGLVGRANRGLMPISGHSGVQGGADVGCVPTVDEATRARWEELWGFPVPHRLGMSATEMIDAAAMGDVDAFWLVGGNFLETLGSPGHTREALERPRLRIHQDIVLSSAMLVEPTQIVLVLPATTRYESPGGGTQTSTERRVIFSPEIPGPRVAGARPEWWVFSEVMARVRPGLAQLVRFWNAAAIRREMAKAIPQYAGIERLRVAGDQFQWGGATLHGDHRFATPDGRARFAPITVAARTRRPDHLYLSTRRGRQFNSMIHAGRDALTGARRHDVLMSAADAAERGLRNGAPVRVVSAHGVFDGLLRVVAILPGNVELHWPEANVLLPASVVDPASLEPDFHTQVRVEALSA